MVTRDSRPDSAAELTVPDLEKPQRLDRYLAAHDTLRITRNRLQQLIGEGLVRVNDRRVTKRHLLRGGETITVIDPPRPQPSVAAQDIPFELLYHDQHLAVVNKPPGLVVHPAPGNPDRTLVNGLVHRLGSLAAVGGSERPGIVHRLDKDTSGLMVVACSDRAYQGLREAIEARRVKRTYLAIVCGHMAEQSGRVDLPIGRSRRNRKKMAVGGSGARPAVTAYRLRERFRSYDLLEIILETGRTHQIRVHFAHLGHPVLGDPDYGGRDKWHRGMFGPQRPLAKKLLTALSRQALLAARLQFAHPVTGQSLDFSCEPPPDLGAAIDLLSAEGR